MYQQVLKHAALFKNHFDVVSDAPDFNVPTRKEMTKICKKWWDKVSIDVAAEAFAVARQQSLEVMSRYSDGSFLWSFGGPLKKEGWEGISLRTPQLAILYTVVLVVLRNCELMCPERELPMRVCNEVISNGSVMN